jgi:hypothetical protein
MTIKSPMLHAHSDDTDGVWITSEGTAWACGDRLGDLFDLAGFRRIRLVISSKRNPDAYQVVPRRPILASGDIIPGIRCVLLYELCQNVALYKNLLMAIREASKIHGFAWVSVEEA